MIKSILNIPDENLNSFNYSQKLSPYNRNILTELCTILELFEEATNEVQKGVLYYGKLDITCHNRTEAQSAAK